MGSMNPVVPVKFFEGEKWMVLTGLLGLLLAGICAVWVILNGGPVAPNGDVLKAVSFDAALGIFLLTTAAITPFAAMGTKSIKIFRRSSILITLFCYFAETAQNFRGVNPRFVENGTPFDNIVSALFSLAAFLLVLNYLIFAVHFFRRKAYVQHAVLIVGIRYSMIAVMFSFAAGIWISINQGRFTGLHGNIIWLHGLGFHALQAVPFAAWLAERKSLNTLNRHTFVHLTGIAYVLGLVAIGWQTYLGYSIFHLSVVSLLAICSFLIALVPVVIMLRQSKSAAKVRIYNH
ncbi:hypothetical protein EHS13_35360 [Paenibacillus psychroresistens]|uniref:Uncharacterized protein n=2 Tax=Paenibacillus psychroresistens TaxID=1778678 RepID=A0A6B8RWY9_9BACL|nr:hypothetical protein EHS13_35360 [Paenibacillus psychroresistens]